MNSIDNIIQLIDKRKSRDSGRTVVAIDGVGGAGKSTLALRIKERLNESSLIEMDDFYSPINPTIRCQFVPEQGYQNFFDWQRLKTQVFEHIHQNSTVRYQKYDWTRDELNGWTNLLLGPVVIIEGVYVLRPELRQYYDLSIFVETSLDVCTNRLQSRGNFEEEIRMWQAAEKMVLK